MVSSSIEYTAQQAYIWAELSWEVQSVPEKERLLYRPSTYISPETTQVNKFVLRELERRIRLLRFVPVCALESLESLVAMRPRGVFSHAPSWGGGGEGGRYCQCPSTSTRGGELHTVTVIHQTLLSYAKSEITSSRNCCETNDQCLRSWIGPTSESTHGDLTSFRINLSIQ